VAQNYPNPFNPTTRISFDVAKESSISLEVYNMLGQKVRTLIDNQRYQPGIYSEVNWDAKDDSGNSVANGIYYLIFSANEYDYRQVRKMVFMK
jgi:flagellar hook assembly protein FlgD